MQRELTFFGFHGKVCMMIYIYISFLSVVLGCINALGRCEFLGGS